MVRTALLVGVAAFLSAGAAYMIVFSINIHGSCATDEALDTYRDSLFSGGQLEALRSTVAALRTELSSPSYKHKVYLAAHY